MWQAAPYVAAQEVGLEYIHDYATGIQLSRPLRMVHVHPIMSFLTCFISNTPIVYQRML